MSASTGGPTFTHRVVATIKSDAVQSPIAAGQTGPSSPQTPLRGSTSVFSSPSSLRADEETLIVELGTRVIRVGLSGDAAPKAVLSPGPAEQCRTGDFTSWLKQARRCGSSEVHPHDRWCCLHEIWGSDIRYMDLGLVADKLERTMRDALCNHLLVDSRPRRICLVLPPALPIPLLSTVLDTLFNRFHAPSVSLASSSVMTAIAAGVRSATVVDVGWTGTNVSSVYEYREIRHHRSTRGGRRLVREVHKTVTEGWDAGGAVDDTFTAYTLSFEECEDITIRSSWVPPLPRSGGSRDTALTTVQEQPETHATSEGYSDGGQVRFVLSSPDGHRRTASVHTRDLAEPCENTFFASQYSRTSFDDEESPLPELIYRHLLSLPIDARATCMSRLIFTGGCARIPGFKQRLHDEVSRLLRQRGWDAVVGRAADVARAKATGPTHGEAGRAVQGYASASVGQQPSTSADTIDSCNTEPDRAQQVWKDGNRKRLHGELRVLESLGPWTGASLAVQLKAVAIATVDRELWLQQGIQGASRPSDVDLKAQQRQSLGSGVMRGAMGSSTLAWTLGAWGYF